MRNYLIFDGIDSRDFHVYLANVEQFNGAEKTVERKKIPGRNGDLAYCDGSFENVDVEYSFYSTDNSQFDVDSFREVLMSIKGYMRLEDTFHPDEYRVGMTTGNFSVETSDRVGAAFNMTFSCKPQRFLRSGETKTVLTSSGMIQNPTRFTSKPLIRVYGAGSISANGKTMTVTASNDFTNLDSDIMDAFKGVENRNAYVKGDFIELVPGKNNISISGFSKVEITPRWWKI